jgi:hypothetical protein
MKNFLLATLGSLVLLTSADAANAQDRGQRGPQSGYGNNGYNDRGRDNDDHSRYRGYDQGSWRMRNGNYWNGDRRMSPADYQRWRRYQQRRQLGRRDWAYQQGVRDGRRSAYGNRRGGNCGNGRW